MGRELPNQFSTFELTAENDKRTTYGGAEKFSKLEEDTRLVTLFAGYPFSLEYNEERGHAHALEDVRAIKRVNEKTHATCYSCKSSDNPRLWTEMGMAAYDKMFFSEMTPKLNNTIGCANCHEASTMKLVSPTRPWMRRSRRRERTGIPLPPGNAHGGVRKLSCRVLLQG